MNLSQECPIGNKYNIWLYCNNAMILSVWEDLYKSYLAMFFFRVVFAYWFLQFHLTWTNFDIRCFWTTYLSLLYIPPLASASSFYLSFLNYLASRSYSFPDSLFKQSPKTSFLKFACFHIRVCRFFKMQLWSSLEHHSIAKELNNCGLSHHPFRKHENIKELYITQRNYI